MSEHYACGCPVTSAGVIHRHDCVFASKMMDEGMRDALRFISRVTNPDGGCPDCAAKDVEIARLDDVDKRLDAMTDIGVYPKSFQGKYETRTPFMEGWNAAVKEMHQINCNPQRYEQAETEADKIARLTAELADANALLAKRANVRVSCHDTYLREWKKRKKVEAKLASVVEALLFYADKDDRLWEQCSDDDVLGIRRCFITGTCHPREIARRALAAVEVPHDAE